MPHIERTAHVGWDGNLARGAGTLDGESARLRGGSCVHLPAELIHCLENHGPGEMHVLGVFRPAGSPAEAYYPDGSAAIVPAV